MYTRTCEDSDGEKTYKSRKNRTSMKSFSATLLDEIYRSTESNAEEKKDSRVYKEKPTKRQIGVKANNNNNNNSRGGEEDETARFRRACLVEKWMEKEAKDKIMSRTRPEMEVKSLQDNDLLFFSSTSSSSDSSGALSSSDTELFGSSRTESKVSCFSYRGPKPIRTGALTSEKNRKQDLLQDDLIKSKSRAMKIYSNLKKVKQPISPGGRLTNFINSLFTNNANRKHQLKDLDTGKGFHDLKSPKASSSTTCSSASTFSRSCLTKYPPRSTDNARNHGAQRTVRFHPVSVILDEDSRPCGHKCIDDEDSYKGGRPPLPPHSLGLPKRTPEDARQNASKKFEEEDYDDGMSDSSSDLFELDHLTFLGNDRFCEQLPVYETIHFDPNGGIETNTDKERICADPELVRERQRQSAQ